MSFSSIVSETTFGGVVVLARHELPSEPQKHAVVAFSSIVPETTFGGVVVLAGGMNCLLSRRSTLSLFALLRRILS